MKNGFLVFLISLVVLGGSWCGFVLAPVSQLGVDKQTTILNSSDLYPVGRPGEANQGLQVYRANGCAACHTEQVQQSGVACEVDLTGAGTNRAAVEDAIKKIIEQVSLTNLKAAEIETLRPTGSPEPIIIGATKEEADAAAGQIAAAGGKTEIQIYATGSDIARGWGRRHSVAEDYLYDSPVQLGSIRIGPDLADVGARLPDNNWQLLHLYAPQSVVPGSAMPSFRYLFQVRKIGPVPSLDALNLPKEFAPPAGYEVVPTAQARQLAAYLLSLHADVPLRDAPFTQPLAVSKP
jgi:cbb3-type cytochrome oxidase cytochrome c subunit